MFGVALACAALGFVDDCIKISKRRSLGLSARWKLLVQIALAVGLWWVATEEVGLDPAIEVRVFDANLYLGPVLYVVLIFLVIAGASNGVNLSDGLDGLAAGSLRDRAARLHGDHDHERAGGPRDALGLPRRGVGGLPMVQRLPGIDVHGRHRVAGPRRRRSARSP